MLLFPVSSQNIIKAPENLRIPARQQNALSGSQFMKSVESLSFAEREERIFEEISKGNIPLFLRKLTKLEGEFQDAAGITHKVIYKVMPDYLAIGSDLDYCRVPMGPNTAQRIADLFGAILPTSILADEIYKNADIKLEPITYAPVGNLSELVPKFVQHNNDIEAQIKTSGAKLGELIAGIKKDVVVSNKILDPKRTHHVVIYGWHKLDGLAIQPLTNIHIDTYVDYSHGIRLLNNEILLDGKLMKIADLLRHETLHKIFSIESEPMVRPHY